MKKILIVLFFGIIFLSGCTNKEDKIYVGKVDVLNDINQDSCELKLAFFSMDKYEDINCIIEDEVISYSFEVDKNIKMKSNNGSKDVYMHEVLIKFHKQEINLNEVVMEFDGKLLSFDIGSFIITDVYADYSNRNNIVIDVMYPNEEQGVFINNMSMDLKVINLSLYDIAMVSLENLNKKCDYKVVVSKINELSVSSNEAKISETVQYSTHESFLTVSTYLKYEYTYKTSSIIKSAQYFKIEIDNLNKILSEKLIDFSYLSSGNELSY